MATVRKPSSLAARKMRMAISLRLAASSLRIGLVFLISEAIDASCEILHCFILATRPRCSFSNLENQLFFWTVRGDAQRGVCLTYGVGDPSGMARCVELAGLDVTIADFNCCRFLLTLPHPFASPLSA